MGKPLSDSRDLAEAIRAGDRRALARAITTVESTRQDHREAAEALLAEVMPARTPSIRLGITGAPGVGKSTFIEAFGRHLIGAGHKVAVLAVDPTSSRSGGSILGDKTRMHELSRDANAFIRPSPSGGNLGGVARRTREAIYLVEAAGYDVVVVETVGVGQSEYKVADMVDMFILLIAPAGGDELQGIKRGIMELADLVVVNKADGDLLKAARHAAADHRSALGLIRPKTAHWRAEVLMASALEGTGMEELWAAVGRYRAALEAAGALDGLRREQARRWLWSEVDEGLLRHLREHAAVRGQADALEQAVIDGRITPSAAARQILAAFLPAGEG